MTSRVTRGEGPNLPERTWADDGYRRAYEAIADRLEFRSSEDTGVLVIDHFYDPEQPVEVQRVITVKPGIPHATAAPFVSAWAALAWETTPAAEPRERLLEALLEGHLRAMERLTGITGVARLPRI